MIQFWFQICAHHDTSLIGTFCRGIFQFCISLPHICPFSIFPCVFYLRGRVFCYVLSHCGTFILDTSCRDIYRLCTFLIHIFLSRISLYEFCLHDKLSLLLLLCVIQHHGTFLIGTSYRGIYQLCIFIIRIFPFHIFLYELCLNGKQSQHDLFNRDIFLIDTFYHDIFKFYIFILHIFPFHTFLYEFYLRGMAYATLHQFQLYVIFQYGTFLIGIFCHGTYQSYISITHTSLSHIFLCVLCLDDRVSQTFLLYVVYHRGTSPIDIFCRDICRFCIFVLHKHLFHIFVCELFLRDKFFIFALLAYLYVISIHKQIGISFQIVPMKLQQIRSVSSNSFVFTYQGQISIFVTLQRQKNKQSRFSTMYNQMIIAPNLHKKEDSLIIVKQNYQIQVFFTNQCFSYFFQ